MPQDAERPIWYCVGCGAVREQPDPQERCRCGSVACSIWPQNMTTTGGSAARPNTASGSTAVQITSPEQPKP